MAIFGIDIAEIVAEAITGAGGLSAGVLIRTTSAGDRDATNPSLRSAATETRHTLEATIETKQRRQPDSAVAETISTILIIAGTISPPIVPAVNDVVEFEAEGRFTLTRLIRRDPASATYEFEIA